MSGEHGVFSKGWRRWRSAQGALLYCLLELLGALLYCLLKLLGALLWATLAAHLPFVCATFIEIIT